MIAQINPQNGECRYFDIRKLSPRECGRLMGCPEWSLDKMLGKGSPISNSAAYKLFGNSIVVDVMFHLFKNIWFFKPKEKRQGDQLSLFDEMEDPWTMPLPTDRKLRLLSLCSGYDSHALALHALSLWTRNEATGLVAVDNHIPPPSPEITPVDYELTAWAEFDPESRRPINQQPAVVAHNLIFPEAADRNLGDMTKIDWQSFMSNGFPTGDDPTSDFSASGGSVAAPYILPGQIDLLTYSTPCTDISQAGKRAGIAKGSGTRSAILWYTEDAIKALRPKVLMQENVAALVNQQNMPHFRLWLDTLQRLGYRSFWKILNAKDYGVPQNRDRVFCVSVRKDIVPEAVFTFPEPMPLDRTIADVLDENAEKSLFLKPDSVTAFLRKNEEYQQYEHKNAEQLAVEYGFSDVMASAPPSALYDWEKKALADGWEKEKTPGEYRRLNPDFARFSMVYHVTDHKLTDDEIKQILNEKPES